MLPWSTESLGKFCSSRWFILSISSSASSVTLFRWLSNSARAAASVASTSLESSPKSATAWAYTNVTREVMSNKCALVKTYNICRTVFRTFLNGRRQIQKKRELHSQVVPQFAQDRNRQPLPSQEFSNYLPCKWSNRATQYQNNGNKRK